QAGAERVDWAVIDVEGGELDVLRGFDLARFTPRVLVIEDNTLGRDDRVPSLLAGAGYSQALWIGANRVFVRDSDKEMSDRARSLSGPVSPPFARPGGLPEPDARLALPP